MNYLSISEVAKKYGFHKETIRRKYKQGQFPNARIILGEIRIPESDIIGEVKPVQRSIRETVNFIKLKYGQRK